MTKLTFSILTAIDHKEKTRLKYSHVTPQIYLQYRRVKKQETLKCLLVRALTLCYYSPERKGKGTVADKPNSCTMHTHATPSASMQTHAGRLLHGNLIS